MQAAGSRMPTSASLAPAAGAVAIHHARSLDGGMGGWAVRLALMAEGAVAASPLSHITSPPVPHMGRGDHDAPGEQRDRVLPVAGIRRDAWPHGPPAHALGTVGEGATHRPA